MAQVKNKVCLIVHDGWGISSTTDGNAIHAGDTTNMDTLAKEHSYRTLAAHGLGVGLSDGLMGNSEVGHLNIGAGRIVWQDIVKIDVAIKKKEFHKNPTILDSFKRAKDGNGRLHLLGLISDGGVHSHIHHLFALLEAAKEQDVPHVYIHFFGDGRDTSPRSATTYMKQLLEFIEKNGMGEQVKLATVVGRYYAMDRDKRWERVKVAVDALTKGEGEAVGEGASSTKETKDKVLAVMEERYKKDETDEFFKPMVVGGAEGRIKDGDTLFFFNYRSDRMREIVSLFGLPDLPIELSIPKDLHLTTMSRYNVEWSFPVAYPPQAMTNVLAEWLSKQGVKQAHIAETEKYAHVTFFFNGGVEKQFPSEERHMVPSPKVATYDLEPPMSAAGVAQKVADVLASGENQFVMCNFAPPDMVGHTGKYDAAVEAISATDRAVGVVAAAAKEHGYVLLITADHGNAEQMKDPETGNPHTAHTTNPVPFIIAGPGAEKFMFKDDKSKEEGKEGGEGEEEGALCDVAPTVLEIMGLEKPEEMSGRSLLVQKA